MYDQRITDEYSDYNIARTMVGIGGVIGFGAVAGVGIMKLNNSAFMKSLGKNYENKAWKYNTGTILTSGTALNTSQLLRQSVEHSRNLGVAISERKKWEAHRRNSYISKKNGFLDNVIENYERIADQKQLERADSATKALENIKKREALDKQFKFMNQDLTDFYSTDIEKTLLSDNLLNSPNIKTYSTINKKMLGNRVKKSLDGISKGITGRQSRLAGTILKLNDQLDVLSHVGLIRREGHRIVNGLKSWVDGSKTSLLTGQKLEDIWTMVDSYLRKNKPTTKIKGLASSISKGRNLHKTILAKKNNRDILNNASKLQNDILQLQKISNKSVVSRELGIDFSTDPSDWATKDGRKLLVNNVRMKNSLGKLGHVSKLFQDSRTMADDLSEKLRGIVSEGNLNRNQIQSINEATAVISDFTNGNAIFDDIESALIKTQNILNKGNISNEINSTLLSIANVDDELDILTFNLDDATKGTPYHKSFDKLLTKTGKNTWQVKATINERLSYVSDTFDKYISDRIDEVNIIPDQGLVTEAAEIKTKWNNFSRRLYGMSTSEKARRPVRSMLRQSLARDGAKIDMALIQHQNLFAPKTTRGAHQIIQTNTWTPGVSKEVFTNITDNILEKGRLLGSSGTDFVIETYKRASQKGFDPTKPGTMNMLLGSHNPLYEFRETFMGKDRRLTKLADAMKNAFGAEDVSTHIRTIENGTLAEIVLQPMIKDNIGNNVRLKSGAIKIQVPVTVGNIMFKNSRAYALPGIVSDRSAGVIRAKSALVHFVDEVIENIDDMKHQGFKAAVDNAEFDESIYRLRKMVDSKSKSYFGTAGTPGLGKDITDASYTEATKMASQFQDLKLYRRTSSMTKRALDRSITYRKAHYYVRQQSGTATTDELWNIRRNITKLERKKRLLGTNFTESSKLIDDISAARTFSMNNMTFSIADIVERTNGLLQPTLTGTSAVNVSKGVFGMLEGVRHNVLPDMPRNMKAFMNMADPYRITLAKFQMEAGGYTMDTGLTFKERYSAKGLLELGLNKKQHSPIYKRLNEFRTEVSSLEKVIKNANKMGRDELLKLVKDDKLKASLGNLGNISKHKNLLNALLERQKNQLKLMDKIYKYIDHPEVLDPIIAENTILATPDKKRIDKMVKHIWGTDVDTLLGRTKNPRPTSSLITADGISHLQQLGLIKSGQGGGLTSYGAGNMITQLNVFTVDYAMGAEGVTYLSETGAKKLGWRAIRAESNSVSMNDMIKAVNKATARQDITALEATNAIKILQDKLQTDNILSIEKIHNEIGTKDFESFYKTMNQVLNSTDMADKTLKKGSLQQKLIEEGSAAAQLSHIHFDGKNINLKYDYMQTAMSGSKLVSETTDKYMVNLILKDQDFLKMQRGLSVLSMDEKYVNSNKQVKQFVEWFKKENRVMMNNADWDKFTGLFKGVNNRAVVDTFKGMQVADMIGTSKRWANQGKGAHSTGVIRSIFSDILDLRLGNRGPTVTEKILKDSNGKMQSLYEDIFGGILDTFTRDSVRLGLGPKKFKEYSKKRLSMNVQLIKDPIYKVVHVGTPDTALQHMYKALKTIEGSQGTAIDKSKMQASLDTMINQKLTDAVENKTITPYHKRLMSNRIKNKISRMLTIADKKAHPAISFIESTLNIAFTTQNPFELSRATERGNYSAVRGFRKGAKLSVYDAMMVKMMGMPYTGQKMIEHMKHGAKYVQNYLGTMMEMMDMDPTQYWDSMADNRSDKIRTSMMAGNMNKDIITISEEYKKMNYDNITELKKAPSFEGILNVDPDEKVILEKGIFPENYKQTLDDRLDDYLGQADGELDEALEGQIKELSEKSYNEIQIKDFAKMADEDRIKAYRTSSTRVSFDDIQSYQKMLRKYKKVSFGINPDKPLYQLNINALRGKQLKSMALHSFGEREYSKDYLMQISGLGPERKPKISDDIFSFMTGTVDNVEGKPMAILNDALRTQLAFVKAAHMGENQYVLNVLANERFEALAKYSKKIITDNFKKGLPATVSGIGMGQMAVRYDRMNAWSVVQELNEKLKLGLGGSKIMRNKSRDDLIQVATDAMNKKGVSSAQSSNIIKKFLYDTADGAPGRLYSANPGETVMSSKFFVDALSTVTDSRIDAEQIAADVISGKRNWMSLGVRFPTMRETNTMPMSINLFDHQILKDLGKASLHKELSSTKFGVKEDTFLVNMFDAGLQGGDLDRDMYMSILAIDDKFATQQTEMNKQFRNSMTMSYEVKNANGNNYAIVTEKKTGKRANHMLKKISKDVSADYEQILMDNPDLTPDQAALKALRSNKTDMAYIGNEGKVYLKGKKALRIIEDSFTMNEFENGRYGKVRDRLSNKGRRVFHVNADDNIELQKRLQTSMMDKTVIGRLSDEELISMVKHKNKSVNALINDTTGELQTKMKSMLRIMKGEGYSSTQMFELETELKSAYATMKKGDFKKYLNQVAPNSTFKKIFEHQYRQKLPEITGSLMAIKTLTGEVHNVGKYLIGDVAMTIFGDKDPKKALRIASWAGELTDANILGKHRIPVITEDVIKTVRNVVNPNVGDWDLAESLYKLRKGEFNVTMSRQEMREMYQTGLTLRNNMAQISSPEAQRAASNTRKLVHNIRYNSGPYSSVTNHQYQQYLKNKQTMSKDKFLRGILNLNGDEMTSIREGIKGIEKGIMMTREYGTGLLEARPRLLEAMTTSGAKNMREMMAAQTWLSNFEAAPYKIAGALKRLKSSPLQVERTMAEVIFPKLNDKLAKSASTSIFNSEPVASSMGKRITNRIANMLENQKLGDKVDIDSFRGTGFGTMLGIAAVGFIGAFAIHSNKREWLGPTAGTGGEYSERRRRKDEEHASNSDITSRLRDRDIMSGAMHFSKPKEARIIASGIRRKYAPTIINQLKELRNPDVIDEPLPFYQFS